jgi:hypothetical protein
MTGRLRSPWVSRSVVLLALLVGSLTSVAAACNSDDSNAPLGSGDKVIVDVDATMQPQPPAGGGGADSPFARVDSGYPGAPDGYNPVGVCKTCACPKTDYCFGGGTGFTTFSGSCTPSGFGIGCQPLPAACGADASCDCLLQATAADVPCYPVCVQITLTLYCPNP